MLVYSFPASVALAEGIAKKAGAKIGRLVVKKFPDGESYIRFLTIPSGDVVIVNTLWPEPNNAIIETILAVETAKRLGAKKITAVLPYLAYMRQDKEFNAGESISSRIIARLLGIANKVVVVNPHLHRIKGLNEVFPCKATSLNAGYLLGIWARKMAKDAVIIGPDEESFPIAEAAARAYGTKYTILKKTRISPEKVKSHFVEKIDLNGRNAVVVDDIISTGGTIVSAIRDLRAKGVKKIFVACIHGLFMNNAVGKIKKAGAMALASSNTLVSKYSSIDVSELIAKELKK